MPQEFSHTKLEVVTLAGDGIGPEIIDSTCLALNEAVLKAYSGKRSIHWQAYPAGKTAQEKFGTPLPEESIQAIRSHRLALKGPLTTPVGKGYRSANVQIRQALDLYACLRPVHSISGLPSPLANQEKIDVVVFRENSEDLYAGIEFEAGTSQNQKFFNILASEFQDLYQKIPFSDHTGIGIKPISRRASQRIARTAIMWALQHERKKITLVHKGNIRKFTEGAFLDWVYAVAEQEFGGQCFTQRQYLENIKNFGLQAARDERTQKESNGFVLVNDVIADVAFEQAILQPQTFDVVVTTNLNGDYLSDAFSALAGGVGISPSGNINPESGIGVFEANHGSADDIAGQNKANPCSLMLSGAMLLDFCGWQSAADLIRVGVQKAIFQKEVTFDLVRLLPGAKVLGTREFTEKVITGMDAHEH